MSVIGKLNPSKDNEVVLNCSKCNRIVFVPVSEVILEGMTEVTDEPVFCEECAKTS